MKVGRAGAWERVYDGGRWDEKMGFDDEESGLARSTFGVGQVISFVVQLKLVAVGFGEVSEDAHRIAHLQPRPDPGAFERQSEPQVAGRLVREGDLLGPFGVLDSRHREELVSEVLDLLGFAPREVVGLYLVVGDRVSQFILRSFMRARAICGEGTLDADLVAILLIGAPHVFLVRHLIFKVF